MCSLAAMPELLLSHSPPDFYYRTRYSPQAPPPPKPAPSRPCLASPPPRAAKKKVVFADDKGYSLTQVRVMREPSNAPPTWSLQFLAQVMRDLEPAAVAAAANEAATVPSDPAAPASDPERWVPEFAQPASDYLQFRERLDSGNVSLENVIVRDAEGVFTGTVKVRNLNFHKEVKLRWTPDGWQTYRDEPCTYVENTTACSSAYVLYDTFSFRVTLPSPSSHEDSSVSGSVTDAATDGDSTTEKEERPPLASRRVEFCVCFRCGGHEYWDNNGGANYALVRKTPCAAPLSGAAAPAPAQTIVSVPGASSGAGPGAGKFQDALRAKLDSWSEFASWNHLVTDGPYW